MKNRNITFTIVLSVLACFAFSPQARATCQDACLTNDNTVQGDDALISNTGSDNTAIGFNALFSNTDGDNNTAIGSEALSSNTEGFDNVALGTNALKNNIGGFNNEAIGYQALLSNTTGIGNVAVGTNALQFNTNGNNNTATGDGALGVNRFGDLNTAYGNEALSRNTTGSGNTAIGDIALVRITTSGDNIAVGDGAGSNLKRGDSNIYIGNIGLLSESGGIHIGTVGTHINAFMAGIFGVTVASGVPVIIDSNGHLGTTTSSARFKDAIKPMDKASETILALKPVTFRYKDELDPAGILQFGLVAEQVEKVNPDLVARDEQGKPYSVRYEAVNAMLLNEFLKEHKKVEEQQTTIAELKREFHSKLAEQQKRIEALTKGLERVSAQLEADRSLPQAVAKNP